MNAEGSRERSLTTILAEMKDQFQEFLQTRIELLRQELDDKARGVKAALPFALVGVAFLTAAFLLLSLALVAALAAALKGNSFQWFFGFLIVGFIWLMIGGIAGYKVKRQLTKNGVVPRRTIRMLNGDKAWLQREVRKIL